MTKEQYINMNRGINDQSDLPDEFLSRIYDDIAANPIKTNPSAFKKPRIRKKILIYFITYLCNLATTHINLKQKRVFQNMELKSIAQIAYSLMEAASFTQAEFTTVTNFEQVQLMFEVSTMNDNYCCETHNSLISEDLVSVPRYI